MKGLLIAMQLANWEQRSGKPICEQVDMIYGVSIGGILACIVGSGLPASKAVDFFTVFGPKIFQPRFLSLWGLVAPRYGATSIELVLEHVFGQKMMSSAKIKTGLYALDIKSGDPVFFKSFSGDDIAMQFACRASSAAQTYFPSFLLGKKEMWDGGNCDNNPSNFAYADARILWPDDEIRILSLGCGMDSGTMGFHGMQNAGLIRAGLASISLLFEADSSATDYTMNQLLGKNYMRFQPVLPRPLALDDASVQGLSWLRESGQQAIRDSHQLIDQFLAD